ncbi:MAG: 16S rRNA (adenine(1518)-N(6)/adenine(1519)-N(6))-dimethyltransferase RsmA [Clostridia bacterium]|nr:16S rRNA (adenine(1518)-N(6)/adenine(1519)-N(6))-dimethyltransferase RsmA [Clostridia bacterium]MBP5754638.1 16S rRNA (adenine(1518)-N(6)/adenine(1519)-N(6))-dimethyltransferase RsmA [Clostridia bacterium]
MKLTDLNTVRGLLSEYGAAPDKRYGQNFLISERVVSAIADNCGAAADDGILEIGPGIGVLTVALCERYKKVVSVEIDRKMIEVLGRTTAEYDNFTLINEDILKVDLNALTDTHFSGMNVTVCANLPYYITSPIIMHLLESGARFDNVTVMIQREVADRLTAKPGTPDYGSITPAVEYYADAEKILSVPAGCFYPAPKVDSAVLRLKLRKKPEYEPKNKTLMFEIIKYAFLQRRKTLVNALSADKNLDKSDILSAVRKCGFDEKIRGEALSILDFRRLSDELSRQKGNI